MLRTIAAVVLSVILSATIIVGVAAPSHAGPFDGLSLSTGPGYSDIGKTTLGGLGKTQRPETQHPTTVPRASAAPPATALSPASPVMYARDAAYLRGQIAWRRARIQALGWQLIWGPFFVSIIPTANNERVVPPD